MTSESVASQGKYSLLFCFSFSVRTGLSLTVQHFGKIANRELLITNRQCMLLATSPEPLNALGNKIAWAGSSLIVNIEY